MDPDFQNKPTSQPNVASQQAYEPPVTPSAPAAGVPGQVTGTQALPVKKSKKKPVLITLAIVLILLISSAMYYVFAYLPNTPDNILLRALANTTSRSEVKSGKLGGKIKLSGDNVPPKLGDINVDAALAENGDISLAVSGTPSGIKLAAEARFIGEKEVFVKVDGLNNVGEIVKNFGLSEMDSDGIVETFNPLLTKLNNQWIAFEAASGQPTDGVVDEVKALNLSQSDSEKLARIYKDNPVLKISEVLPDDNVDGAASYHYRVAVDKDNLVSFMTELKNARIKGLDVDDGKINSVKGQDFSKVKSEIWIKKSDRTINQIYLSGEEDGTKSEIILTASDVNQKVEIERPAGARQFQDIFSDLPAVAM